MSDETVLHPITHKVQARDDHPEGDGSVKWFASLDDGDSYVGVEKEPQDGDVVELKVNVLPISLAYPRGFRICSLTIVGEPVDLHAEYRRRQS